MPENIDAFDPTGIAEGHTPSEPYDCPEEDKELLGHLNTLFEHAYRNRLPYERQWELERLYLKGDQLIVRDGDVIRRATPDEAKRLWSINNQLRPLWRSLVGKLNRMEPTFATRPATMDYEEVQGARVADAFIQFFREKEGLGLKYQRNNESIAWCGNAATELCWDPNAGSTVAWCSECDFAGDEEMVGTECPVCSADFAEASAIEAETADIEVQEQQLMGQPADVPQPIEPPKPGPTLVAAKEGDLKVKSHDIRDVFPEPGLDEPDDLRYVFLRDVVPTTEVRRRFPHMARYINSDSKSFTDIFDGNDRLMHNADTISDHVHLYKYIEVPSYEYPEGRVIYFLHDLLLGEYPNIFSDIGRLPVFWSQWAWNPGEFWAEGPITQAWHRQKELNTVEMQIREYVEMTVRMKLLNPWGSRIKATEFGGDTEQVITYNPAAGKPEFLRPPPLPAEVFERRNALMEDMRQQFGITIQEQGSAPGSMNGRAMAIIESEADQQVGPIVKRNIREWGLLHRAILITARKKYHPDRQFSIAGENTYGETFAFAEMNLQPGWDLILETDDGMSQNSAVRMQDALGLLNAGVFGQPGTPEANAKFLQVAKLKIPGQGPEQSSADYAIARELLFKLENSLEVDINEFMAPEIDVAVFAEVLMYWLKGKGRKAEPQLRDMVRQIWMQYNQLLMQQQQQQMMAQMGGPGAGGGNMTAPGGSPNNAGGMPSGAEGSVQDSADQMVSETDSNNESLAAALSGG